MAFSDRVRKSGGYLNNVDALIVDLTATNTPDFGSEAKERAEGSITPLWLTLTTKTDGAEKPETTNLSMGGGDDFVVADDGRSIVPTSKDAALWADTPGVRFLASGYANGIPDNTAGPGEPIDFTDFVGYRARFVQVKDEKGMERMAKKVKANPRKYPKYNTEGQRQGKDKKFYDQRNPEISAVYGKEEAPTRPTQGARSAKTAGKQSTSAPATSRSNGKTNGSVKAVDSGALATFAGETLVGLLQEHDGSLKKVQLNQFVTRGLAKDPRREDVRKFLFQDDNLQQFASDGITVGDDFFTIHFDKSGRDQVISLQQ
jgi:hypothetical protein